MKQFWKELYIAVVLGLLVPGIILWIAAGFIQPREGKTPIPGATSAAQPTRGEALSVAVLCEGVVTDMDLQDYLTGVVLAEMPVSFEPEALKAQAVVARTYTMKACRQGRKHETAAVCADSTCCQGYIAVEDYLAKGGKQEGVDKIRRAVEDTYGYVLIYDGALIEATYFSCSGGFTEDAVAVWGTDVPYLRATSSPGEEKATHYTDTVTFSKKEFQDKLGRSLAGNPKSWFGVVTYTTGGGVNTMEVGGRVYKGTELRTLLGLRSTAFSVASDTDSVTITTRGFGHRVGMSQYGADAMAVSGSSFEEILAYYYQGTSLVIMEN